MNVVQEVLRINETELRNGLTNTAASWHAQYASSAWVFIGNLSTRLTEGDVLCVMSQFGEVEDVHLVRDNEDTGKSRGFGFLKYEDARSCVLAVDNLNGSMLLDRTLRVDHVQRYRLPKHLLQKEEEAINPNVVASDKEENIEHGASDKKQNRVEPGHAYQGQQLANDFHLHQGQDLFAPVPAENVKSNVKSPGAIRDHMDEQEREKLHKEERRQSKRKRKEERDSKRRKKEASRRRKEDRRREIRAEKMKLCRKNSLDDDDKDYETIQRSEYSGRRLKGESQTNRRSNDSRSRSRSPPHHGELEHLSSSGSDA